MPKRGLLVMFIVGALAACGGRSHAPEDAGGTEIDSGRTEDGGAPVREDAGPRPPLPPELCGGRECAAAEACCIETGTCYDPTRPSDCTLATPPPPDSGTGTPCASAADCTPSQFCRVPGGSCLGAGWCFERGHPGISCGAGAAPVCGCDGRTYASVCAAYEAGTTVSRAGEWTACGSASPAGVVACGRDADCPAGRICCARTSICIDPACVSCCAAPPPGTELGCGSDIDCLALADAHGTSEYYCFGSGCGDTGGGCVRAVGDSCTGELAPVCGCDGTTYTNACWAGAAHTRIAHDGVCE